jgi:hypothetical protein
VNQNTLSQQLWRIPGEREPFQPLPSKRRSTALSLQPLKTTTKSSSGPKRRISFHWQVAEGADLPANLLWAWNAHFILTRFFATNIGLNKFHQNRMVSWLTSIPRSSSRSSTLRRDNGNRTYIITASRTISGLVLKYLKGERFVISRC